MRNVGQSLGLGAVTVPNWPDATPGATNSTVVIENLDQLEDTAYDIRVPNWVRLTGEKPDLDLVKTGCEVYASNCSGCHEGSKAVGPSGQMRDYRLSTLKEMGTDSNHTRNQSIPIGAVTREKNGQDTLPPQDGKVFSDEIFTSAEGIIATYVKRNSIPPETEAQWRAIDRRGPEVFRDTYRGNVHYGSAGNSTGAGDNRLDYVRQPRGETDGQVLSNRSMGWGYPARPMAGIWASPPYLHNGAIPTMYHLLVPDERPAQFVTGFRDYDMEKMGYVWGEERLKALGIDCDNPKPETERFCFYTDQPGNSNKGHDTGKMRLTPDQAKAVIEFLKVLEPEPMYMTADWRDQHGQYYDRKDGVCIKGTGVAGRPAQGQDQSAPSQDQNQAPQTDGEQAG
jgi:hypothetical protein